MVETSIAARSVGMVKRYGFNGIGSNVEIYLYYAW